MGSATSLLCLLLFLSTLCHVTSFTVRRRHARHADLADALRMLERQRRRIDNEDKPIGGPSALLGSRHFAASDLEPWLGLSRDTQTPLDGSEVNAAWLAKTLGLDERDGDETGDETGEEAPGAFLDEPVGRLAPLTQPSDQELDAIFGEKEEAGAAHSQLEVQAREEIKKAKELPVEATGDVSKALALETKDGGEAAGKEEDLEATLEDSVKLDALTKDEFKALLHAVEKLQKKIVITAKEDMEKMKEVVKENIQEAKQEAADDLTPKPEPVSEQELNNLFEEKTKEVIPTGNGNIVRTEGIIKDSKGRSVGREEEVKEVETVPGKATLSSIEKFWYLNNYLNGEGDKRKKRNSKRNTVEPVPPAAFLPVERLVSSDRSGQVEACLSKINQLQNELDKAKLVAYLEDIENDILTDALNQATLGQVDGRVSPGELRSLQEAIQIEEALQDVKDSEHENEDVASDDSAEEEEQEEEKRGEPWRKKRDPMQSEVPYYLTGDDSQEEEDENAEDKEEAIALALQQLLDEDRKQASLQALLREVEEAGADEPGERNEGYGKEFPAWLRAAQPSSYIASLFSENADQCPAVKEFSTNCEFADKYGLPIDFEARALCNVHEMCYACGSSLDVQQRQCDVIYRAASMLLCGQDEDCVLEAEVFLRAMKLKHRYVPHRQPACRAQCTAQFLSII